jgi:hypothetical protein
MSPEMARPRGVRKLIAAHPAHCTLFTINLEGEDEVDFFYDWEVPHASYSIQQVCP